MSSKLASKLAQQLKDVLAICGGGLPPWCQQLVFGSRCVHWGCAKQRCKKVGTLTVAARMMVSSLLQQHTHARL